VTRTTRIVAPGLRLHVTQTIGRRKYSSSRRTTVFTRNPSNVDRARKIRSGAVTIIPIMPDGWEASAGGFPAMTGNVPFLMKDAVLLAASIYLLKQDVASVAEKMTPVPRPRGDPAKVKRLGCGQIVRGKQPVVTIAKSFTVRPSNMPAH